MNRILATLIVLTIALGLAIDQYGGALGQWGVNLWAWAVMLHLWRRAEVVDRAALGACLLIATAGEVVLSLGWGLYDYRLGNIPLFVPPGHVMLYALGVWLAARVSARFGLVVTWFAMLACSALAISGRDWLSVPLTALFLLAMRFGPAPRLYATMFMLSLAMELWGTWLGNWAWRPVVPLLVWPTLNPPLAAGAFYCVLDWLVGLSQRAYLRRRVRLEYAAGR